MLNKIILSFSWAIVWWFITIAIWLVSFYSFVLILSSMDCKLLDVEPTYLARMIIVPLFVGLPILFTVFLFELERKPLPILISFILSYFIVIITYISFKGLYYATGPFFYLVLIPALITLTTALLYLFVRKLFYKEKAES